MARHRGKFESLMKEYAGRAAIGHTRYATCGAEDLAYGQPFERQPAGALDASLDALRERFGAQAVTRAVLIGRDPGLSVPLLPD